MKTLLSRIDTQACGESTQGPSCTSRLTFPENGHLLHHGRASDRSEMGMGLSEAPGDEGHASNGRRCPVRFEGRFSAPGIIETIRLEGRATPFEPRKRLAATVYAEGITGKALDPYLKAANAESALQSGRVLFPHLPFWRPALDDLLANGQ